MQYASADRMWRSLPPPLPTLTYAHTCACAACRQVPQRDARVRAACGAPRRRWRWRPAVRPAWAVRTTGVEGRSGCGTLPDSSQSQQTVAYGWFRVRATSSVPAAPACSPSCHQHALSNALRCLLGPPPPLPFRYCRLMALPAQSCCNFWWGTGTWRHCCAPSSTTSCWTRWEERGRGGRGGGGRGELGGQRPGSITALHQALLPARPGGRRGQGECICLLQTPQGGVLVHL